MQLGLAGKLIVAAGVTLVMALSAGFWVVLTREDRQAREDFKRELGTITGYAKAVREFMAENPIISATDSTHHNMNHVPVIAAWLTAQKYAAQKDYIFRTPSLTPRAKSNAPTPFERRALEAFAQNTTLTEYSEFAEAEGQEVIQYAVPMRLTKDCLTCHGGPAGDPDPFGYAKEGMQVGDLRGAFTLQAPLMTLAKRHEDNRRTIFFMGLGIVLVTGGAIYIAIRVVIRPLDGFLAAIRRIGAGQIQERVSVYSGDEVGELATEFNRMADQLEVSQTTLEERVQERTQALEQSQTQLVQASKLAALGELVGGIAHEVNTPIGIIIMRLASLRPDAKEHGMPDDLIDDLDVIHRQANKIAQITSGLLAFARQTPFSPKPTPINQVVENAVGLVENVMRNKGVLYEAQLAPDLPLVSLDATRIEQVLLNLFNNAMDAMPNGGALTVTTELCEKDNHQAVRVCVKDTGEGIRAEHLDRLFDPFFTTKDVGKGTGLGLSISYGLIQEHGGDLVVQSEWGTGTVFQIELPVVQNDERT